MVGLVEGLDGPTEVIEIVKRGAVVEGIIGDVFGHLDVLDARHVSHCNGRSSDVEGDGLEIHGCEVVKVGDEGQHVRVGGGRAAGGRCAHRKLLIADPRRIEVDLDEGHRGGDLSLIVEDDVYAEHGLDCK